MTVFGLCMLGHWVESCLSTAQLFITLSRVKLLCLSITGHLLVFLLQLYNSQHLSWIFKLCDWILSDFMSMWRVMFVICVSWYWTLLANDSSLRVRAATRYCSPTDTMDDSNCLAGKASGRCSAQHYGELSTSLNLAIFPSLFLFPCPLNYCLTLNPCCTP